MNDTGSGVGEGTEEARLPSRERVLAVATRLFGQKGFGATSVRALCDAAGVTKPTLYYWFQGKEALFLEAVIAQTRKLHAVVQGALSGGGNVEAQLTRFVRGYIGSALADPDGVRLMMTVLHPVSEGQPVVDQLSVQAEGLVLLTGVLREAQVRGELRADVDLPTAALMLVGAANLHIVGALNGLPVDGDIDVRLVRIFLHGVSP